MILLLLFSLFRKLCMYGIADFLYFWFLTWFILNFLCFLFFIQWLCYFQYYLFLWMCSKYSKYGPALSAFIQRQVKSVRHVCLSPYAQFVGPPTQKHTGGKTLMMVATFCVHIGSKRSEPLHACDGQYFCRVATRNSCLI